ncbi:MAG: phenylalanine--tRNA ligase subunit beta [Candidatus Moraniibacteriota bacterium]
MKYSYNKLVELSGTKKTPEELAQLFLMRAFEVESVEPFAQHLENVVIGSVLEAEKHPNADKLKVTRVDTGDRVRQIVCGAPNVAAGQKVAVALLGAKLPGNITIKEAEIRGEASEGMICSEKELGFGEGQDGILVLPDDAPIGMPFAEYAGLADFLLDLKILPDRGADALSYRGLAREIAALERRQLSFVQEKLRKYPANPIGITIVSEKCSRYAGFWFEHVRPGTAPLPLRAFLLLNGLRSISVPVDITNYFLLEYGQPMHAFDADTLEGHIIIRQAAAGETLQLLGGETITLDTEDLVIADEQKVLALAGVMGGMRSAVTNKTTRVFLEIAIFDAISIRRTRVRHNLATDAAYRYERGLDAHAAGDTFARAAELFASYSGADVAGFMDVYPAPIEPKTITLPISLPEKMLGVPVAKEFIGKCLEAFGCDVREKNETFIVTVPTRRKDLEDEWNLVEEIGRTFGYENIPVTAPTFALALSEGNPAKRFERDVKEYLSAAGFDEMMTYSFYGVHDAEKYSLDPQEHLTLSNPLSPELALMRPSVLLTALLKAKDNLRYFDSFRYFEFGSAYVRDEETFVNEGKQLALVLVDAVSDDLFALLKGKVEALLDFSHQKNITFAAIAEQESIWHPSRSAHILADGNIIGTIGEISPRILSKFGMKRRIVAALFSAETLAASYASTTTMQPLPKFPFAVRDISLTFPSVNGRSINVAEAEALLDEAGAPLLKRHELFDVYAQGEEKSLAFHLSFGADDRTLSGEEMDRVFDRIVALAKERFEARLKD